MKIIIIILISLICNTLTFSQTKEQAELPNLTGKIKVDKQGREYIIDPNTPKKRIYLKSGPSNLDIYYCVEGDKALELTNLNITIPMEQPYSSDMWEYLSREPAKG